MWLLTCPLLKLVVIEMAAGPRSGPLFAPLRGTARYFLILFARRALLVGVCRVGGFEAAGGEAP